MSNLSSPSMGGDISDDAVNDQMLLVGPEKKFSLSMRRALECEFPNTDILVIPNFELLIQTLQDENEHAALIVIDQSICADAMHNRDALVSLADARPIAISFEQNCSQELCWQNCGQHFDNFIPIDVRLDVWLAIIRLLMAGGRYVCPKFASSQHDIRTDSQQTPQQSNLPSLSSPINVALNGTATHQQKHLTTREWEVLKLVSLGHQNKIIAAELSLSENTIKLHMHHIISKLGVTNRTEAAAAYLGGEVVESL